MAVANPYLGEIRAMSFDTAPAGWAKCNGQTLAINQNQALFSLLGTTYGGDGITTFKLPDLRGRVPIHTGRNHTLGQAGGEETHTLTANELPTHTHRVRASTASTGGTASPDGNYLGGGNNVYRNGNATAAFSPATVANAGGGQPHLNMQPYLTLDYCIALQGVFPSPS